MKVIILAGGSGTRLWPLSRKHFPKQFLKFKELDNKSLFQETFLRAKRYIENVEDILIVTNSDQKFLVMNEIEQLKIDYPEDNIIIEKTSKNTFPAISLGMQYVDDEALILSSDHLIKNEEELFKSVNIAKEHSKESLITFGINPLYPHTGYGYIRFDNNTLAVEQFVEKPNYETAKEYISSGYLWNAGIFLFNKEVYLKELKIYNPQVAELIENETINEKFDLLNNISIDFALLERSKNIKVIPTHLQWSDLGSFDAISDEFISMENESLRKDNNYFNSEDVIIENSQNNFVSVGEDKIVALCDVDDLLVIDHDDALLICKKNSSHKIKNVVEKLKENDDERLKLHTTAYRPWGSYTILEDQETHKVKRLTVLPGKILSLQSHNHRSEHWTVVKGEAYVVNGDQELNLKANESTYIPCGNKHRLGNKSNEILELIEVQTGTYFGEDDIIRYDDEYGRK